jgi:hypothetical protein
MISDCIRTGSCSIISDWIWIGAVSGVIGRSYSDDGFA